MLRKFGKKPRAYERDAGRARSLQLQVADMRGLPLSVDPPAHRPIVNGSVRPEA